MSSFGYVVSLCSVVYVKLFEIFDLIRLCERVPPVHEADYCVIELEGYPYYRNFAGFVSNSVLMRSLRSENLLL